MNENTMRSETPPPPPAEDKDRFAQLLHGTPSTERANGMCLGYVICIL
jgi:hypothetical protein